MGRLNKEVFDSLQEMQVKSYMRESGLGDEVVRPLLKFFGKFLIPRNLKREEILVIAIVMARKDQQLIVALRKVYCQSPMIIMKRS